MDASVQEFLRLPRICHSLTKRAVDMLDFSCVLYRLCYTKQGLQELNLFVSTMNASHNKGGGQVQKGRFIYFIYLS